MSVKLRNKLKYVATFFAVLSVVGIAERVSVGGNGCQTQTCTNCCSVTSCLILSGSNYYTLSPSAALTDCADTLACQNGNPGTRQQVTQKYFTMGTVTLDCPADGDPGPGTGAGGMKSGTDMPTLATACVPGAT
ncbi:MAG: hypothetical protein ACREHD_13995 [Pirellulales bacterium]